MELEVKKLSKLVFINRQPTLWRHGIGCVEIVPDEDETHNTIGVSPLMLEPFNMDFDGDTSAIYCIHDKQALKELKEKAFILNTIEKDSDNSMLSVLRHETLYASFILTKDENPKEGIEAQTFNCLQDVYEDYEWFNNKLDHPIIINDIVYTYGRCLFNKWCGFNKIIINKSISKKNIDKISRRIFNEFKDNKLYYDKLTELNKKLLFFISSTIHCPTLNCSEMINVLDDNTETLFENLPDNNIELGYHINTGLVNRCINNINKDSDLYKLYKSGSRFSKNQLSRVCINIGYVADDNNIVLSKPIKTNLLKGMTEDEFFLSAPGSRKGISDKSKFTPKSGYLERSITMGLSPLIITEEDCGSEGVEILIFSEKHCISLVDKYYKNPDTNEWGVLDFETAKTFINRKIFIRSPITCLTPKFCMCQKCFGIRKFNSKWLGILAGQIISERLTQLIMRSFHESGSANLNVIETVSLFIENHLINLKSCEDNIILEFDINEICEGFDKIKGYNKIIENKVYFDPNIEIIENKDAVSVMKNIKNILKVLKQKPNQNIINNPIDYYSNMISYVLSVGTPYSSFVEMFFANMFYCNIDGNYELWRYHQDSHIEIKESEISITSRISPILNLLYSPNKRTLSSDDFNITSNNIYEQIWFGKFFENI